MNTVYVIPTRVEWCNDKWVRFEGSQEKMLLGEHHFKVGDLVTISIRKRHADGSSSET